MMEKLVYLQRVIVCSALVVISLLIVVGCSGQFARQEGDSKAEMALQQRSDNEGMAGETSSAMDDEAGDLIVNWGESRKLETTALEKDLISNGIPGGDTDAKGNPVRVTMMTFYRSDGTAFVADMSGREIKPCAKVVNGRFFPMAGQEDICSNLLNTNIRGLSSVTINTHKSPDCPVGIWCNYAIQRCP